jgi:hypothetical protein
MLFVNQVISVSRAFYVYVHRFTLAGLRTVRVPEALAGLEGARPPAELVPLKEAKTEVASSSPPQFGGD